VIEKSMSRSVLLLQSVTPPLSVGYVGFHL
jgi:hypothetical protein